MRVAKQTQEFWTQHDMAMFDMRMLNMNNVVPKWSNDRNIGNRAECYVVSKFHWSQILRNIVQHHPTLVNMKLEAWSNGHNIGSQQLMLEYVATRGSWG